MASHSSTPARPSRRPRALLLAAAAAALLPLLPGCSGDLDRTRTLAEVRTARAETRTIEESIETTGQVAPIVRTEVKSEISGRIARLHVRTGDRVTRDQVLLELDPVRLESDLTATERIVEGDRLSLLQAERNHQRLVELQATLGATEKDLFDADIALRQARNQLAISQARLDKAREDLAQTRVLAPHDGIVLDLELEEGQVITGANSVSNGTTLMTVADLANLQVEAAINELDMPRVALGTLTRVTFDAIPGATLEGRVTALAPNAVARDNVRVFPLEVTFTTADDRIRPGISATVTVAVARTEEAVATVISAVFNEAGKRFVFLREGDRFVRRAVEVGLSDTEFVEIRTGLAAGDEVALVRPPPELVAAVDAEGAAG